MDINGYQVVAKRAHARNDVTIFFIASLITLGYWKSLINVLLFCDVIYNVINDIDHCIKNSEVNIKSTYLPIHIGQSINIRLDILFDSRKYSFV